MNLTRYKLITCILPIGCASALIRSLKEEKGIDTANVNHARGTGRLTPHRERGIGEQTEKDIVNIVVEAPIADDIFEYVFLKANIDRPHGGLIYMNQLITATPFVLPDLPEEK